MREGLRNGSCVISGPSARRAGLTNRLKIICDTPDEVLEHLKRLHDRIGMEHMILYGRHRPLWQSGPAGVKY